MYDPRLRMTRAARTTRSTVKSVCTPAGLRGAATEIAWVAAHGAIYPLGLAAERGRAKGREDLERFTLSDLPPIQRGLLMSDVVAAGTPIILIHGLIDNRSIFTLLRRALRRRGFGRVLTLNYSPLSHDVRHVADRLARLVEKTCEETGYDRVHVVGHSLGGLVARYYVQRLGGDAHVHTLITLGTPHAGTSTARMLPQKMVRQLRPGSEILVDLAKPAPGCQTRFVAFWSDLDQFIVPKRSATIDHPDLSARNVQLQGVGHMSLPIDGRVVREIATLLAHLDEDGTTLTAGITPIDAAPVIVPVAEPTRGEATALRRRLLRRTASTGA